jgi:3-phenylpropionate/trans-cinnamate dioxygenase ferredoxin component
VAFDPWCTHADCPLTDGWIEDGGVRCACHGALFDLGDGAVREGPADRPMGLYPVRVVGGRLELERP